MLTFGFWLHILLLKRWVVLKSHLNKEELMQLMKKLAHLMVVYPMLAKIENMSEIFSTEWDSMIKKS